MVQVGHVILAQKNHTFVEYVGDGILAIPFYINIAHIICDQPPRSVVHPGLSLVTDAPASLLSVVAQSVIRWGQ